MNNQNSISNKTLQEFKSNSFLWKILFVFALFWLVIAGAPFIFQIVTTFKSQGEFITGGLFDLPKEFSFINYISVLQHNFFRYFFNSVIVLSVSLTLLLLISAFAAYPLARMKFKLNKFIFNAIVAAMSIPIHITLIPIFIMSIRTGIYDSFFSLIGPNIAFNLPMSIFILTTFMQSIPKELEEAADIDGCGKYLTFFHVIFPLSRPGLVTLAIYNGVVIWNEFVFAMTLTQSQGIRTLPLAIWEYQGQYTMNIPLIMTLLFMSSLPVIILYLICQEKLVNGIIAGSIKG